MMHRRVLGVVAALFLLSVSACGQPHQDFTDVRSAISHTESAPYSYTYTDTDLTSGRTVQGVIDLADSFRSSATISLNGRPMLDEMLVDDAIALRLRSPTTWNPAKGTPLESLLAGGKWVIDPAGAPPVLFAGGQQDATVTGRDPLVDALNAVQYVRLVLAQAAGVVRFNKDSLSYRPSEDPFRGFVDEDIKAGLRRYDAIAPALPRSPNTQQTTRLPDARFFRKLSVFVKDGRFVRVLERVDFENHEEMRKAKKEGKPKFLLQQLRDLRRGAGDTPVRQRQMSIYVNQSGEAPGVVKLPPGAVVANLGTLVQSGALARLPGAPEMRTSTPVTPTIPGLPTARPAGLPSASPSASPGKPTSSPKPTPPAGTPTAKPAG